MVWLGIANLDHADPQFGDGPNASLYCGSVPPNTGVIAVTDGLSRQSTNGHVPSTTTCSRTV